MIPTDVTDRMPKGYAAVPPAYLPVSPDELTQILERFRLAPAVLALLGTSESTLWDVTGRGGVSSSENPER